MGSAVERPGCWSLVVGLLLSVAGSAAAADLRLIEAVKIQDKGAVQALVRERVDVNIAEADGTTALHWAAYAGDLETTDVLLRAGARVTTANRYGVTPLSVACLSGNATLIERLLKAGADPNTIQGEGETALMTAARAGNLAGVKVLLAHGVEVNAKEQWRGQTALMWAAAEGHAAVIAALVENGGRLDTRSTVGFTPLLYAVREGQIEAVRALLAAGANVNDALPVGGAGSDGPATPADFQGGTSALTLAVLNGHYELAAVLLDAGADPNAGAQGWTPLHQITWVRRPGIGANFPGPVISGHVDSIELVKKLVAHGANLNAQMRKTPRNGPQSFQSALNFIGATPFLLAARTADVELMRLLAELGADPLLPNADNTPPLTVAAGVGVRSPGEDPGTDSEVLEATRLAWELGGDVNAVDKKGETPMHGAAYRASSAVVQFLVDKGAKTVIWNQKNSRGWTPLIIADGIYRENNFRNAPDVAVLLHRLLGGESAKDK